MKKFELKTWLSENRNQILDFYNALSENEFFSGVSKKEFGTEVFRAMGFNNVKSEKTAVKTLSHVLYRLESKHTQIGVSYTKPYSESNHAKAVNYFGKEKVNTMRNA